MKNTNIKILLTLLVLTLLLLSCHERIKDDAIENIHIGMSKDEALQKIGLDVWDIDYTANNYETLSEEYCFKYYDQSISKTFYTRSISKTLKIKFQNNKIYSFYTY
jgi:hypothetical protein